MKDKILFLTIICLFMSTAAFGQMKRERADRSGPIEEMFWTPNLVGMSNVQHLEQGNLNVTVMHNFGIATNDVFQNFFGIDNGPNVRLGLDYGITDRWSFGIGRTTREKIYDFRTKYALIRQTTSNSIPFSVGLKGDVGITTLENGFDFNDRLNFFTSVMIARKFSDELTLQVAPMFSHFNTVRTGEENDHFAIGLGGEYRFSKQLALVAEFLPVIGERSDGTVNAFAIGLNIETGGHVFQLFLESTRWHTEQHIISRNSTEFFKGDFRFGFNINRIFWLGGK